MIENYLMENMMHKYTEYFKENHGFDRLIRKIYEKYQSLSKFSGTIKLDKINQEESLALSKFFGNNYQVGESITISLKKILDIMNNSKY